jgi:hypothetical protein
MRNQEFNGTGKNSANDVFLPGDSDDENAECGGIDKEIEKIFDDLRLVGSPQKYTLTEVLTKAITAEKALLETKAEISREKAAFGSFRSFQPLYATVSVMTLGVIFCLWILTLHAQAGGSPARDRITLEYPIRENAKFLHVENR